MARQHRRPLRLRNRPPRNKEKERGLQTQASFLRQKTTAPLTESFASLFKGCGFSGQSPESLSADSEIPLLKPGVRPGFQPKQTKKGKTTPSGGLSRELRVLRDALFYSFLVDFRRAKIKRGFRALRSAAQGSALRTRSLSRKAGESFNIGCGACFSDPRGTSSQPRPTGQSVQSGSGIPSDH